MIFYLKNFFRMSSWKSFRIHFYGRKNVFTFFPLIQFVLWLRRDTNIIRNNYNVVIKSSVYIIFSVCFLNISTITNMCAINQQKNFYIRIIVVALRCLVRWKENSDKHGIHC
jgi:hypothetical protein